MKRKSIRRVVAVFFAVLLLGSLFPFAVFATDPVSAAVMANALAQAITAYGASNGVSMMFDVASSDGIGEAMHDLWGQFKTDVNDNNVPTYDSLAVTVWSTLFKKVGNNVAINLADTSVAYLDAFWNWLLSGPAEMIKVDNQYYEWSVNQDNSVSPINVYSEAYTFFNGVRVYSLPRVVTGSLVVTVASTSGQPYNFTYRYNSGAIYIFCASPSSFDTTITMQNGTQVGGGGSQLSSGGWYWNRMGLSASESQWTADLSGSNSNPSIDELLGAYQSGSIIDCSDGISVRPYVGDTAPQDVYIPDNEDVNYAPLPYVGPLNIPWQQEWGDGQTVSDAQGTSITGALDDVIADDGTLQLEGDDVDVPSGDVIGGPDSYQVPGLADVFPFCIPFDIYNFLSALAAEPQAPSFECDLVFPEALGGTQNIELDFDTPTFNQLAQLLRLLELLAFIVGLALLTRSMFIRG